MVAPALAAAYLVAAPVTVRTRLVHLLWAAAGFVVSAGWFVVLTMLWPASSRPYIAGSTDNNFMNLVLGYNGFARVLGHNHPGFKPPPRKWARSRAPRCTSRRGSPAVASAASATSRRASTRLFSGEFGFEIGWLVPAAVLAIVLVVVARGRAPRTDPVRAGAILFGGWILVDGLVLSFMQGMIHAYYSLSIAPAVAAMFAIGVSQMWARRESWWCRVGSRGARCWRRGCGVGGLLERQRGLAARAEVGGAGVDRGGVAVTARGVGHPAAPRCRGRAARRGRGGGAGRARGVRRRDGRGAAPGWRPAGRARACGRSRHGHVGRARSRQPRPGRDAARRPARRGRRPSTGRRPRRVSNCPRTPR